MTQTQHQAPPFSAQVSILNFEKVVRKKLVFGEDLDIDINIYCHRYLLAGHTMFFVKKRLSKTKRDFEGSVSQFLVQFCDMLVQLNHSNCVTRNQDVFVGSSEISTIVIVKHV